MSDSEHSPLLAAAGSTRSKSSARRAQASVESTPLLSSADATPRYDGEDDGQLRDDAASIRSGISEVSSARSSKKKSKRWPSIVAITILALLSIAVIVLAFVVPAAVEEYAKEATVIEPTNLSLDSITANGVRARIQANVRLDGDRVKNEHVRRVGRMATWLVRELGTEETTVSVYLPEYGNILLGKAGVPAISISVLDGRNTAIDVVADLIPGDAEGIRTIANDWLDGKLDQLRVQGKADIPLKSGIIPLGTHSVSESFTFEANKLPSVPEYNITRLNFHQTPIPGEEKEAMAAEVSISAFNSYPVSLQIPALAFQILVPGCHQLDPYILVAAAVTSPVDVRPHAEVVADVHGIIRELPESLTRACPDSTSSPLDILLKEYLDGKKATIFVRGQEEQQPDSNTPGWLSDLLSSVSVPVPFPARSFDNLIRNFSLTDVHFTLPDPGAEPDDPDAVPKVSGTIHALAALPSEMSFDVNVTSVRATADVFYKRKKLGELDLEQWQPANSTRVEPTEDHEAGLMIQSHISDAPLNITDGDVFTDVIQTLLFGRKMVLLDIHAAVDVKVETVLGQVVLNGVPAQGKIPIKPLPRNSINGLNPSVGSVRVLDTTSESVTIEALVNVTNPTPYTAHIPSISIHVLSNGSVIGVATARDLDITTGNNTNLPVSATWNPSMSGDKGRVIGRTLLSEYLSGFNTTVTLKTHQDTFPSQPLLGKALSKLNLTVDAPRLRLPGDGDGPDDGQAHFIREATFHLFSSTATFTLASPLQHNTIYIDHVNATALYNHTEPVGHIQYDLPFAAPPGISVTPKLPVDWSLDSVGYEKVRQALGGRLKLDAHAIVGVRLGSWTETVWYVGRGIGASIRI